jgi:DNA-binding response OmpR family regulator
VTKKTGVILLAEDDLDMRSLLCDELWDLGYPLKEAANGDDALRYVLDSPPALIITDLRMPAGGFDYVVRLRNFAPTCPIILMTSFGDAKTKAEALEKGVAVYFDKPVRIADLKAAVKRLLNHHPDGEKDMT